MSLPRVSVVVPTYNEALNIGYLLDQLLRVFDALPRYRFDVVIADDTSPDGTAQLVSDVAAADSRVHLSSGPKSGLGNAYRRGFEHALVSWAPDFVVQMDADFSHSPQDIERLLLAFDVGQHDVVIGSRYVRDGSIDSSWSVWRRMLSRAGNLMARHVAGLDGIHDCTAGFKAMRAAALRSALTRPTPSQGYVFNVAMLKHLTLAGARVLELPILFRDRRAGKTKLGWRDIYEFCVHVWWLRSQTADPRSARIERSPVRFDGHITFARPLTELATVFEMTGLAIIASRAGVRSDEPGFEIRIEAEREHRYRVIGSADPGLCRAEEAIGRVASAFEADGIDYRIALYEATGAPKRVFAPSG